MARATGVGPSGTPFRFDLPESETRPTAITCPGPKRCDDPMRYAEHIPGSGTLAPSGTTAASFSTLDRLAEAAREQPTARSTRRPALATRSAAVSSSMLVPAPGSPGATDLQDTVRAAAPTGTRPTKPKAAAAKRKP
jgi:hypothetical protein